ncbi:pyridoxine biosynthesis amidotransferase [Staphylococcus aureus]|nr:pyridoxine biosynthesis amidotransferase [Staphylococcus aureus]
MKIGVLALQGAVREHIRHIELSGHEGIAVKKVEQLEEIEGLILPGGESTTLRRLMNLYGFKEALQKFNFTYVWYMRRINSSSARYSW